MPKVTRVCGAVFMDKEYLKRKILESQRESNSGLAYRMSRAGILRLIPTLTMHSFTKLLAPALLGLALAAPAAAQDVVPEVDPLQVKLEAKLAKSFVAHGNWVLDYDEAKKIAKEEGKLLFVYFTRSYSP